MPSSIAAVDSQPYKYKGSMSKQLSQTCCDIAAGFSEGELKLFEDRLEAGCQNVTMGATDNLISLAKGNQVFNTDLVSNIKQEEDTDFTETDDSDNSDPCDPSEGEHIGYATRSKTGSLPPKQIHIKNEAYSSDYASSEEDSTLTPAYNIESASEPVKGEESSSEESINQCAYKTTNLEMPKMPGGCEENMSEYKLQKITLYETGFCVLNDPFVAIGAKPGDKSYYLPEKPRSFKCNKCGICFGNSGQLNFHMVNHKGDKTNVETLTPERENPISCTECKKRFFDEVGLKEHMKTHSGTCNNNRENTATLMHSSTLTGVTRLKLQKEAQKRSLNQYNEWESALNDKSSLQSHAVDHRARRPYACSKCVKCFTRTTDLVKHVRKHKENSAKSTVCEASLLKEKSLAKSQAHSTQKCCDRNIQKEEKLACTKCEKTFSYRTNLVSHLRTHTGERPFKCNQCDKGFSHSSTLYKHQTIHVNPPEKPFQCSSCGECFTHASSLAKHRRTHTIERPYKCYECERSFTQNTHLIRHQKTHREDQRKAALVYHQWNNHDETDGNKEFIDTPAATHPRAIDSAKIFDNVLPDGPDLGMEIMEQYGSTNVRGITTLTRYQETHSRIIGFDDIFIDMELQLKENKYTQELNNVNEQKSEKWFTCDNCGQRFNEHLLLIKHERSHI